MLDFSIVKLKFLFSNCDVHVRNFIPFQAYYNRWKSHYPVESAIWPLYNPPLLYNLFTLTQSPLDNWET
jgi:hypothetical protein